MEVPTERSGQAIISVLACARKPIFDIAVAVTIACRSVRRKPWKRDLHDRDHNGHER